jgi:hypothetical protein
MWINKFGFIAINQKSPKDITEGILFITITYLQLLTYNLSINYFLQTYRIDVGEHDFNFLKKFLTNFKA